MRRRITAALTGGLCCLMLAGCNDDEEVGPEASTAYSSGPTASTSTDDPPTTTPDADSPPQLPDAAKAKTVAGAKAFVRYYVDTLNYANTSGSTIELRALAGRQCKICSILAGAIDRLYREDGFQTGGDWTPQHIFRLPTSADSDQSLRVEIHQGVGAVKLSPDGPGHVIHRDHLFHTFELVWQNDSWRLSDVEA